MYTIVRNILYYIHWSPEGFRIEPGLGLSIILFEWRIPSIGCTAISSGWQCCLTQMTDLMLVSNLDFRELLLIFVSISLVASSNYSEELLSGTAREKSSSMLWCGTWISVCGVGAGGRSQSNVMQCSAIRSLPGNYVSSTETIQCSIRSTSPASASAATARSSLFVIKRLQLQPISRPLFYLISLLRFKMTVEKNRFCVFVGNNRFGWDTLNLNSKWGLYVHSQL